MLALDDVKSERSDVVITVEDVINVVDLTWFESHLVEIGWLDTTVSILTLVLREVGRVDVVGDVTWPVVPFLIVVLLVVMMRWVDCKVFGHIAA